MYSTITKMMRIGSLLNSKKLVLNPIRSFSLNGACLNDYKAELTAKQMNNDNPFDTYVMKPEVGRGLLKSDPILVPSISDSRLVLAYDHLLYDQHFISGWSDVVVKMIIKKLYGLN